MRSRKCTEVIAAVVASAALAIIVLSSCEFAPRVDRKLHAEIGRALAREALSLLGQGGQITLITRDTEAFRQPALDVLLDSFKREVRRAQAVIAGTQLIQADPLRPVEVPSGDYFELIRRSSGEHVIVSLLGPPLLTEEQRSKLGRVKPKIVAFCSGGLAENIDLPRLLEAGLLHSAVVSRPVSQIAVTNPSKTPNSFEQLYTTVRAPTSSNAPAQTSAPPDIGSR